MTNTAIVNQVISRLSYFYKNKMALNIPPDVFMFIIFIDFHYRLLYVPKAISTLKFP